jgi:uncharacterized membrane protein
MQDLLWQLKETDAFTVYITAAFAAAVFWFIREIVAAPGLAVFAVPFLMAGGVFAPVVFRNQMITLSYDKDANVAAMTGIGVLAALVAVVVMKWLWVLFKEWHIGKKKIAPVTKLSRPTR